MKLLWGLLAFCVGGTAVALILIRIFWGGVLQEPTSVEVQIEAPAQVVVNESFAITLQLTNIMTTSQTLHSLDFDERYLENVSLSHTTPPYHRMQSVPLTNFTSYLYELELPVDIINRPTVIELTFISETVGEFSGLLDVCLEDGTFCVAVPLETAVVE